MVMRHFNVVTEHELIDGKEFPRQHPTEVWAKSRQLAEYLYAYHGIKYLYLSWAIEEIDASDLEGSLGKLCNGFYPELN